MPRRFAWTLILLGIAAALGPLGEWLITGGPGFRTLAWPLVGMLVFLGGCVLLAGAWISEALRRIPKAGGGRRMRGALRLVRLGWVGLTLGFAMQVPLAIGVLAGAPDASDFALLSLIASPLWLAGAILLAGGTVAQAWSDTRSEAPSDAPTAQDGT